VPVLESRHGQDLLRFFRRDQRYQYVRWQKAASPPVAAAR
jgi:hypothetical protein